MRNTCDINASDELTKFVDGGYPLRHTTLHDTARSERRYQSTTLSVTNQKHMRWYYDVQITRRLVDYQ